jgi:hypothetical protein
MLRTVASKVAWVGRTASMVFGLALVLALVLGIATMALAAVPGDPFKLGQINRINDALTTLIGSRSGPMMAIDNDSSAANARALDLRVEPNRAPMAVNSDRVVKNLNADKLDGQEPSQIGHELWAHVNSDGTLVRGNGVNYSGRFSTGHYFVSFNRDVSFCGYVATTTDTYAGTTGTVQGASYGFPREVSVYTIVGNTGARADLPFHLVVAC